MIPVSRPLLLLGLGLFLALFVPLQASSSSAPKLSELTDDQQGPKRALQQPKKIRWKKIKEEFKDNLAMASLWCGVSAFVFAFVPVLNFLGGVLAVLALLFGILGLRRVKKSGQKGKGLAVAGVILSSLWLFTFLLFTAAQG